MGEAFCLWAQAGVAGCAGVSVGGVMGEASRLWGIAGVASCAGEMESG